MRLFLLSIILVGIFSTPVYSDFLPHDKPTSDFEVGTIDAEYAFTYRSWLPIKRIDGHIDVQVWDQSLIGKVEGGYRLAWASCIASRVHPVSKWLDRCRRKCRV